MDLYNIIRIVVRKIASICNSGFFLFSGYLFFIKNTNFNRAMYVKKLKARINTLLIPYLLWNIINVLIHPIIIFGGRVIKQDGEWNRFSLYLNELFDKRIWNIFLHYNTWGNVTNILGRPMPGMGPFSVPMWFLQTLIVLTICTPLIYILCKYAKIYGIIVLGILYYTGIWPSLPGCSIGAFFFFTLGAWFGIHNQNMLETMRKGKWFWYVTAFITLIPSTYFDYDGTTTYNFFTPVFIPAAVISAINIASCLLEKKLVTTNKLFSKASFFIYGMHTVLVLPIVGLVSDTIFKSNHPLPLTVRYFSVPVITAYACVGIYCIMQKIMPKIVNILSGNR